ncbi:MAG: DciA family protein [Nautiliaceae bacterium]
MRKADKILNHLLKPFSKDLQKARCLRQIISLLPKNYKKFVSKGAIKNNTLFLEVTHPAIRKEIYFNQQTIKYIINTLKLYRLKVKLSPPIKGIQIIKVIQPPCKGIEIKMIKTFYKYKPLKKEIIKTITFPQKSAKGEFKIKAKNPKITKKFEEIKTILKERG